jgi:hypothetical protein
VLAEAERAVAALRGCAGRDLAGAGMGRGVDRVAVGIAIGVVVIEIGFAGRVVGRVGVSGDAEERQQEYGKASGNVQLNDRMERWAAMLAYRRIYRLIARNKKAERFWQALRVIHARLCGFDRFYTLNKKFITSPS